MKLHLWRGRLSTDMTEFFSKKNHPFSPLIYPIISSLLVGTRGYSFHSLDYNPNCHYLFCCLNDSSFDHWDLFPVGSRALQTCPPLSATRSVRLLSDTPGHSRLPSGPGPRIGRFSEGSPGSSWQLETKMWVLGVLVYRSVPVSGPLGGQRRVIHMCLSLLTHVYTLPVIVLHCVCVRA